MHFCFVLGIGYQVEYDIFLYHNAEYVLRYFGATESMANTSLCTINMLVSFKQMP